MEIEEKLNEFMEMAYTSIEETMYYPTIVNNIHDILKTYNAELKKRKLIFKFNKFMAKIQMIMKKLKIISFYLKTLCVLVLNLIILLK